MKAIWSLLLGMALLSGPAFSGETEASVNKNKKLLEEIDSRMDELQERMGQLRGKIGVLRARLNMTQKVSYMGERRPGGDPRSAKKVARKMMLLEGKLWKLEQEYQSLVSAETDVQLRLINNNVDSDLDLDIEDED